MEGNVQNTEVNQNIEDPASPNTSQITPPDQSPVKIAIILLSVCTLILVVGGAWLFQDRIFPQPVSQESASEVTVNTPITPATFAGIDYTTQFTVSIPEGYTELKRFESESHSRSLLALKTPDELQFNDPYILFRLVEKNPNVTLEKFAYDSELCADDERGTTCEGRYNPPYENKEITVDGRKAIWQRINSLPAGDRVAVYIEKSPTEVIIVASFAQDPSSPTMELDERIIPIIEELLASFRFVE